MPFVASSSWPSWQNRPVDKPVLPHQIRKVYEGRIFTVAVESVTLPRGLHRPEPLHWPRVGIYHVDGEVRWRWRMKVSPLARRIRASGPWESVDGVRRRLVGPES